MELGQSVIAPLVPHTHTIIFLHGRGDTSANMADSLLRWARDSRGRSLVDALPSVRWVFPQAEVRVAEKFDEECPQWFDIWNLLDMTDREELQVFGLRESVLSIRRIVRREAKMVGALERVVLAGISQGAATAVHTLLHLGELGDADAVGDVTAQKQLLGQDADADSNKETPPPARLGALVGLSGWLSFPGGSLEETREVLGLEEAPPENDDVVRHTPVFLGHCADDPLVFIEYGKQLRDSLRGFGMEVSWNEYADGGHWINSPRGVDDVVAFLMAQGIPTAE
ncbi:alpha/beta-hydrolase [Hypoxylon crocopeplum]|nr:alpha/beta-hydrolase [Hypoxylon crocopeplum]